MRMPRTQSSCGIHAPGALKRCWDSCARQVLQIGLACGGTCQHLQDKNAAKLLQLAVDDSKEGRMSVPVSLEMAPLDEVLLNPRFGVEQLKEDGSIKVRAIDHFSWSPAAHAFGMASEGERLSKKVQPRCPCKLVGQCRPLQARKEFSVNGHVMPTEKLRHDTLDALALAASMFVDLVGVVPALFKADVDSAFRRIPIMPQHRWACGVGFRLLDQTYFAQHFACPFGAVASVHAWERVGAALTHIARKLLRIALSRYVDDMFAPERQGTK